MRLDHLLSMEKVQCEEIYIAYPKIDKPKDEDRRKIMLFNFQGAIPEKKSVL